MSIDCAPLRTIVHPGGRMHAVDRDRVLRFAPLMDDNARMSDLARERERMVRKHIEGRGIRDPLVLDAMQRVPREAFLQPERHGQAYDDIPLPIGWGQTISQPYVVALMISALGLRGGERCLEIGAGSGYSGAILASIAREVFTVERHAELARDAAAHLAATGFENVHVVHGDGSLGLAAHAPFDAIVVTAGGPRVPSALVAQLSIGGRLVMPVGEERGNQRLVRVTKLDADRTTSEDLCDVRFVPLIGAQGWDESGELT